MGSQNHILHLISRRYVSTSTSTSQNFTSPSFSFLSNNYLRSNNNIFTSNYNLNHNLNISINNKNTILNHNHNNHNNHNNNNNHNSISTRNYSSSKLQSATETVSQICHPTTATSNSYSSSSSSSTTINNSHIPFDVKIKNNDLINKKSIIEQYLKGDEKSFKQLINPYITLTKPHLTFLIMLSSICSYILAPNPLDFTKFFSLTIGTLLTSGAANAINMGREPKFDSQMVRTSTRPVVKGLVKPYEAFTFASIIGSIGCTILFIGVNPIVSYLAALNIILYSWFYTSLKRKSILNTWLGAIVGAIPPLMGWASNSSLLDPGAWSLALLLYAWQFPHFNSLSHNIKDEYKRAGYVMTAFVNPKLNARVALRYSLLMFPICFSLIYFNVCDKYFAFDSSILNFWMTYNSFKFWLQQRHNYSINVIKNGGANKSEIDLANIWAKKTFWSSIWQLPLVLALAMLHKQGQWDRFFNNSNEKTLN